MKIRYLLLGLMICVAGAGTINSSDGSFGGQNATPFLIFGHVWYEDGSPCNNPIVNITNADAGWCADTVSDSNFYQTLLRAADVNAGDVLRWSVTDDIVFDTTNCTVDQSDLGSGGIFEFDMILQSIAPGIIGYAPESPVYDIENAARRFNITIDQVVDVAWQINGSPVHTNESVTDAAYTHTNVAIGVWNISANVSNENGTVMQKWIWNVTTLPLPNITSFAPPSHVRDTENVTRTFNITIAQVVDVTWLINGIVVQTNESVIDASYTNTSAGIGVWNVTAVASNQNGTDAQEWIWDVTQHAPTLSSVFVIYGNVSYDNGSTCNSPSVVITNLNTSEELVADNRTGESFYQLVTSSAFANAGDVLRINAHKNGMPVGNATLTVNRTDIGNGVIKVDINKRYLPDFTVTNLTLDLPEPLLIGDLVMINATIANHGVAEGETFVEFYDNKSITIERSQNDYLESPINDTITLPDILRIRVHFESSGGNITIYNESRMVERITCNGWTKWCDGGTIRIESWNAGFTVDRYEAVLANESITLGEGNFTNLSAKWNLSLQEMGWATHGTHNITVRVDPCGQVIESDETNNEKTEVIDVNHSLDFAVTEVSLNPSEPVLGDVVEVSANITNYGVRNGTTVVGVYYDNRSMELERTLPGAGSNSTDIITLPPGVLGARLHLEHVEMCNGEVAIYDGDGQMVERIAHSGTGASISRDDEWTDWIYGENITIRIEIMPWQYQVLQLSLSTNLTWEDDLNNGTVPEDLKDQLKPYGVDYLLSDNATVEKEKDEWIINDGGRERYCIGKESDELVVYYYYYTGVYSGKFTIDRYEALIAEEPVTLNVTESKIINASWLTGASYGAAREHDITVRVDPRNHSVETNETNNTRSEGIFVNGTDLTVTAIEILYDLCYIGQDVDVAATIANIGAVDATNFTVEFLEGSCECCSDMDTISVNFTETHIERLNSGENMTISVIWNPAYINNHTITARIPYDTTDNNENNNELSDCSDVEARYDFSVEDVNVDQQNIKKGESVNITATVGCTGHGGGNVSIAFFVNSTDFAGTCGERFTKIGTDNVHLEVNETNTTSMSWDVDVVGGCHLIAAVINPDNELEEFGGTGTRYLHDTIRFRGDTGNNVKTCTLHVDSLDPDITNLTLDPAEPNIGDMVNVSATIRNNGSAEVNSTVWFYMETDELISGSDGSTLPIWSESIPQPGDCQMRVHFDYIKILYGGEVSASVNDSQDQGPSVYFYIKCEEYGGQDVKTPKIGFTTDCYYIDVVSGPGYEKHYRRWDGIWTDWTNGTAIEICAAACATPSSEVHLLIDKYQVRLGNETITLDPGESMVYNSTWNASLLLKPGKNYTVLANVEDVVERKETYLGGTDLAITNLSVKPVGWDGEAVWVNATIENLGRMDATDFRVDFTEVYSPEEVGEGAWGNRQNPVDSFELFNTTHIECLDAGNSTNISILWNASIREIECKGECWDWRLGGRWVSCSWSEIAENYTIKVKIDPLENLDLEEDSSTNHSLLRDVHVDYSRDFNVTNLSFRFVNGTARDPLKLDLYDDVILNATVNITNHVNWGGSVDVSFYIDEIEKEHEIGSCSIAFDAGNGTEYAEIEWNVVCLPGEHNITVVADPEEKIYEIDETNNDVKQRMHLNAPDLVLESLDVHPKNPEKGEMVRINVTIANEGNRDASNVTLCIYDWAERHIEDANNQSGPGQIGITRENATAMRLYLDLSVEDGGKVCINDNSGGEIICYHENFHGWTPWVLDNSITIVITNNAYARVSKVYHLASSSRVDTSTHSIGINETENITINWNTSVGGERFIAVIVDPEDCITEYNESNNMLAEFISVQTADIKVSNLSLAWLNGTKIGGNDTIKHGDNVNITADIANIGVEGTDNFSVRFLVDDIPIEVETILGLENGSTIQLITNWSATVGSHVVKVEADYGNEINETNETNNIMAWAGYVCGAELSGNISWVTLGLDGKLLFPDEPTQPYDEDEVNITVDIRNLGCAPAENFSAVMFFDYVPDDQVRKKCSASLGGWENRTYPDAEYIYLKITTYTTVTCRCIVKDDVIIYDGNGSEVARPVAEPEKPCWVRVNGSMVNVSITGNIYAVFNIDFYPIYQNETSMLYKEIDVSANSSHNLFSINQNVGVGDFTIMVLIDPEYKVPEDEDFRDDNVVCNTMHVKPTRNFTVTDVIAASTDLSDLDTTEITAGVSNIGLRNGTTEVKIVDYEDESRTYKYHFNRSLDQSYLPIAPDTTLSGIQFTASGTTKRLQNYEKLMIIHRPGVDAIKLHFDTITLRAPVAFGKSRGRIEVCNETGAMKFYREGPGMLEEDADEYYNDITLVPGETAYICTYNAGFKLDKYTTEKGLHREDITLNATKAWNESKNITAMWNASTGDHYVSVTLDSDDKISEISESNNELGLLFHVNASREPVILDLNFTPEHPEDGDNVDISAIIANNGSRNASFTFDLWVNTTRNEGGTDEYLPDANLITELGDRIRYIKLLKHANLTLAPGENVTVNAAWNDISVFGSPIHRIIAIVDPLDEIDEMNESNNEIEKEIIMAYPDLTIGGAYMHGGTGKPVVNIKEIGGVSGASDVTVRFESYETEECNKECGCIPHPGASNMQVYFDHIDARNGYVGVGDERYSGREFSDVWSPWVVGDSICIKCRGGGTWVYISEYRWGNVSDEQIDHLGLRDSERVEMPWEYEYPLNVNVTVDPDNNITELDEDNNNETLLMYADLRADKISFSSPSSTKLSLDAEKFKIDGYITNGGGGGRNDIVFPVSDFNVTLEFRRRYQNGTIGDAVFNMTKYIEDPLCVDKEMPIRFEFDPSEELEVGGNYTVFLIADSSGDVCESNELYPEGEDNNVTSKEVYVYNTSGYTGGGELINVVQGEVNGRVVYTIGDEGSCEYRGMTDSGGERTVKYTGVVPKGSGNIEFARMFVYWFTWEYEGGRLVPVLAGMDATFNGQSLTMAGNYSDNPIATTMNAGYGLYSYDVTKYVTKGENDATVRITSEWSVGIHAIGLLVVYEDEDEPLTKYWVNEGADIMMAGNGAFPTGLPDGDCITTAAFDDVERDDTENVNASLLTVLGFYAAYGVPSDDALKFNDKSIGSRISYGGVSGYWGYHYRKTGIALTRNRWEDVTDDLERGDNLAEIRSKGNYMMPNNAFLRLIFPPDLNIIDLTAPASTVVGAHHSINVTIRNDGRSDAHDFNATLEIDGMQMVRIPHLDLPAGENMTLHLYNWTPMLLARVYNLTAAADVLSGEDWTEIETDNNALTKYVPIEEGGFGNQTGPRGTGGGSNPTGGEYTEKITGRIMQGTKEFLSGGGGGGAGMFSALEWIMKGAVWLVLVLFVCAGYRMEQGSYGRVRAHGYAGGL